ncbi:TatD family hydrolase [Rhodanobacter lindaniclasticus]
MHPLVDSHAHLDLEAFDTDRPAVIARAGAAGIRHLVVPATDHDSWPRIRELCVDRTDIHPAYGLHPLFMDRHRPEHLDRLGDWLAEHPAVAVGEIGLDFHQPGADHELQQRCFESQLQLALDLHLPVIVHARQALEQVSLSLRRTSVRGVVHSFSGSEQQARKLWDIGFHLGIGGPVTYERAQRLRRIVAGMPIEFLLLESDAPDQPDAAHRGQRNEPARIVEILRCVAALRGESEQHVAQATTANARRLFGLDQNP